MKNDASTKATTNPKLLDRNRKFIKFHKLVYFTLVLFFSIESIYGLNKDSNNSERKFAPKEIASDIRFLIKTIQKTHPNIYHSCSKSQLKYRVNEVIDGIKDSLDAFEAALEIGKVTEILNEGHLSIPTNDLLRQTYKNYTLKFPVRLFSLNDSFLVVNEDLSNSPSLLAFDKIYSINGIPVATLVSKMKRSYGGLDSWRNEIILRNFGFLLYSMKIKSPFVLGVERDKKLCSFALEGNNPDLNKKKEAESSNPDFRFKILNDSIAYLDFFSMNSIQMNYEQFCDSIDFVLKQTKSKNIHRLIIDLRNNGGGDSMQGDMLLSFLTEKKHRFFGGGSVRYNSTIKKLSSNDVGISPMKKFWATILPGGIVYKFEGQKPYCFKTDGTHFEGKYVFLIGTGTFSSANALANGIKDFELGTLIGEPTAEPCNDYGDMLSFTLPNTKLVARAPYKFFVRANGDSKDTSTVIPDFIVRPSLLDAQQGKDTVLEYAIKHLTTKN